MLQEAGINPLLGLAVYQGGRISYKSISRNGLGLEYLVNQNKIYSKQLGVVAKDPMIESMIDLKYLNNILDNDKNLKATVDNILSDKSAKELLFKNLANIDKSDTNAVKEAIGKTIGDLGDVTKGVGEADLLAQFAKSNGVESLPLSYDEILKFCGGRRDLAVNLVIATKEAVGGKTVPELVDIFKLPNNPAAGSLSTYQTRIWYKWQESLIGSKLDYSKSLEEVAKDAFEMRNTIRTQARASMSDQAWAEYLMQNEKNMTFEQLVKRNIDKGLTGDELWNKIIQSSMSSRDSVNSLFQLD